MIPRLPASLALALLSACASGTRTIKPSIDPGATEPPRVEMPPEPPPEPQPAIQPESAFRRGLMPLKATGVSDFLAANPVYDGRGVLIGILDSGLDVGIDGLAVTSTGERKVLDLRDFSDEGYLPLQPLTPHGDSISVDGMVLTGFSRVVTFNTTGPYYGGLLLERSLGEAPAADVDGNGRAGDSLGVVVTRASDGWVVFVDTDRDGSLATERPVHDYLAGRETFGWAPKGRVPPLTVAVNLSEQAGRPRLDLFFDTFGHGTHVAGIAAGYNIYGVPGFNGVAPGAQLLGLKIANNAQGSISTTGSMLRAIDYAIRFAADRRLPLVLNMSFGVGNELEGTARIDQIFDSVLAAHPDLVFTISAGNDGPGLSTMGFPGSARRALTIGALLSGLGRSGTSRGPEPVAYFSSRGGELAKPDLLTPGVAYSTVPRWHRGEEQSSGTSMASPHAAGLAALLISGLTAQGRPVLARAIRQSLMVTAAPVPGESYLDVGAGIPDVGAAWRWLQGGYDVPDIQARVGGASPPGLTAAFRPAGLASAGDTLQAFILTRPEGPGPASFTLRSNAPWLIAPKVLSFIGTTATVTLRYLPDSLPATSSATGVVTGWPTDTMVGPVFRLVNTIGRSVSATTGLHGDATTSILAGTQRRLFIAADSGQPFEVSVAAGATQPVLAFMHEPGGMPLRGAEPQVAAAEDPAGVSFRVDGRDVIEGLYEVVAVAPPASKSAASFSVTGAAFAFDAKREPGGVVVRVKGPSEPGERNVSLNLVGAERMVRVIAHGSDSAATPFVVPAWASHATIDLEMDRAQWSRFTDFGVTLFDSGGRRIKYAPLTYAFGRMTVDFKDGHPAMPVTFQLFPGLAEPGSTERWAVTYWIRLYADHEVPLAPAAPTAPASGEVTTFAMPSSPWPLGDAFYPLGALAVSQGGKEWTREVPLPEPAGPVMR